MFSIFKKKSSPGVDLSGLVTDMHSHLLPGIDDGSPDTVTSVTLKKGLEELGYSKFIATPHIMWDMYKNTASSIDAALQNLLAADAKNNIRAAAEYYMDDYFNEQVKNDQPLLTLSGKKVLVEFSFVAPPLDLKDQLFQLQIKGYEPVLAHPERYAYFASNKTIYQDFKSMGCLLQLNLLSLTGYYGKTPQELANWLISKNFIDLVGTDLHHHRHLDALRQGKHIMPAVQQLLQQGRLLNPMLAA
ncbi:MAG TPA: CpsB/CapC family capsule biosynthesis tyrosine phosphatase [Chitinophagaceae bacterium]|nr:CpsB/CapC family capsule biosynthesis tyrosine phosphatase [Chitinophagaceae bacterium]